MWMCGGRGASYPYVLVSMRMRRIRHVIMSYEAVNAEPKPEGPHLLSSPFPLILSLDSSCLPTSHLSSCRCTSCLNQPYLRLN